MSDIQHVYLVGHCSADAGMLTAFVRRELAGVAVGRVNDAVALRDATKPGILLLVNRVLDGRFDTHHGVGLIEHALAQPDPPVALLISNYADAQADAVAAGALPGFGKGELRGPEAARRLRDAAGVEAPT
ncbi:MAG: hypothetical protein AAF586_09825 [Planctomycetota bacterium]